MSQGPVSSENEPKPEMKLLLRGMIGTVLLLAFLGGILFLSAGTTDWRSAWVLIVIYGAFLLFFIFFTAFRDPELLKERGKKSANVKSWDKVIAGIYNFLLITMLIICGLDVRYGWSSVPFWLQLIGMALVILGGLIMGWVTAHNTFLSRYARIQDDRGHRVVTDGPYRTVRHPMYAASLFWFPAIPLMLGSYVAVIPGLAITALYVIRTALEDRMLLDELPGYKEYAAKTQYRLIPGIW